VGLELGAREARALALTAQRLAGPRPRRVDQPRIRSTIEQLGVIQLDSVNVLVRSHYLPLWSRLGAYDRNTLDRMTHQAPRRLFEYWGHEASLLPVATQPLLRWRMARAGEHAWRRVREIRRRRSLVARVLGEVRDRGPIRVGEIESDEPRRGGWWEWSEVKVAMEWLFWSGRITSARRRGFERLYDLPERVLPPAILASPTPPERTAVRALLDRAGRALGVATADDLRDYFRIKTAQAAAPLGDLVEDGVLLPARVEGWAKPAYVHRDARADTIDPGRGALVSPFDSLVWCRARTERLFGMRYRIELYTPVDQRVFGYYVLPFLLGDALVARVDLKADREHRVLRVIAIHGEPATTAATPDALAGELRGLASWLELDRIEVGSKGDLAAEVARAVSAPRRRPRRGTRAPLRQ